MLPVSFIPYLVKKLAPKLIEPLAEQVANMFKLPQILNYMELPNDADKRIDKLEVQLKMVAEDQHPPVIDLEEWEEVKAVIKKIKNKKAFKSLAK